MTIKYVHGVQSRTLQIPRIKSAGRAHDPTLGVYTTVAPPVTEVVRVSCVLEYYPLPRQATCMSFIIEHIILFWPPASIGITHTLKHSVLLFSVTGQVSSSCGPDFSNTLKLQSSSYARLTPAILLFHTPCCAYS